jgi:hypothetical protein
MTLKSLKNNYCIFTDEYIIYVFDVLAKLEILLSGVQTGGIKRKISLKNAPNLPRKYLIY